MTRLACAAPCRATSRLSTAVLRRAAVAGSTLLLLATLAAGCSGESSRAPGGGPSPEGGSAPGGTAAEPARRPFLVIGLPGDAKELDPAQISDTESGQVAEVLYEGLMRFQQGSLELEPCLATGHTVSGDGRVWTFTLRQGVTFHDGTPFDAEAVVFNFQRQLDEKHPNHVPGGKMEYAEAFFTTVIEKVEATAPHEVVVTLKRPHHSFLANLACTPMAMVSPTALRAKGQDVEAKPVGTGPYRFKSWTKGSRIEVERFAGYWGEPAATERLIFNIYEEPQQRLNALVVGEAQLITSVDPTHVAAIEKNPKLTTYKRPALSIGYLEMNHSVAPFDNRAFRQALNHAVDKEFIVGKLMDGNGYVSVGALPPGMEGALDAPVYPYDPEKAKALLAESGVDLATTVVKFKAYKRPRPYNPIGDRLATVAQQSFEAIGLKVEMEIVEFTRYLDDRISGDFQIGMIGWSSDNGQPDNTLFELFGKESNPKRYRNGEANRLMSEAMGERDPARRAELYRKANQLIVDDAAVVFINHGMQIIGGDARLQGFVIHPKATHKLEYLWMAAE